jgi:hypothetical protein
MNNTHTVINNRLYRLIAKAQAVGDSYGSFIYRNLYEPIEAKESTFTERVSVALTSSIPSEKSRHLIEFDTINKHSVQGTGLFCGNIEQTGFELYLTCHT